MTHKSSRAWTVFAAAALLALAASTGCGADGAPAPEPTPESESPQTGGTPPDYSILRPGNRYATAVGDRYVDEVQPALAERCAVCHSCTNGPCQLNLTSYAGALRGVNSKNPYKWGLITDNDTTRLADNRSIAEWRSRGFRNVLPDGTGAAWDSVFFKSLELGEKNLSASTAAAGPLDQATVRGLAQAHEDGNYVCPATGAEYKNLTAKYPMGGMPWGLPFDNDVHATLESWVLDGAPGPSAAALAAISQPQITPMTKQDPFAVIAAWEAFLNGPSLREQLVARYFYEHSYSANVQLAENPGEFYRVIRSRTAAPSPVNAIITDMPMDPPGTLIDRVYYRFEKIDRVIEGKVHVPWEISLSDLDHYKSLFLSGNWSVSKLPGYTSRNPFEIFEAIPAAARSQFMRENSRMLFAQFARGPICLVQAASYAVDEYFWIIFLKPESDPTVQNPKLGLDNWAYFFTKDGNIASGLPILGDKYGEPKFNEAFEKQLRILKPGGLGADDVWTGGETHDDDAWLTVHRNQFSVDVHTTKDRPITGLPTSVWFMNYANFERMYYNAVDEYKYWGSYKHQNDSFNWQIYTRTEAEDLWASLFPDQSYREKLRDKFTSFAGKLYNKLFTDYAKGRPSATPQYKTESELGVALIERMGASLGPEDRLNNWPKALAKTVPPQVTNIAEFEQGLRSLTNRPATFGQYFPNVVHVRIGGDTLYTLLAVRGWKGDKIAASESLGRARDKDYIVAVPGFTAYEAHMFVDLSFAQAKSFITELSAVNNQSTWNTFATKYKIARNSPAFWPFVDWLNDYMEEHMPLRAALLELRVYDKDEKPF